MRMQNFGVTNKEYYVIVFSGVVNTVPDPELEMGGGGGGGGSGRRETKQTLKKGGGRGVGDGHPSKP